MTDCNKNRLDVTHISDTPPISLAHVATAVLNCRLKLRCLNFPLTKCGSNVCLTISLWPHQAPADANTQRCDVRYAKLRRSAQCSWCPVVDAHSANLFLFSAPLNTVTENRSIMKMRSAVSRPTFHFLFIGFSF